jgi:hypothetical protein
MYATLGMSMPSQHFVHAQDRTVIPKIEPPTRPRPVARVLDQASFHGHENESQDSEFQFPPQLAQSRDPSLPKTLGAEQPRATIHAGGQLMQMIEAVIVL